MVCAEARPSGALDRDAFGEHARLGHGRARSSTYESAGRARVPYWLIASKCCKTLGAYAGFGAVLPFMTRMMTSGRTRFPGRVRELFGGHQFDADHGVSRPPPEATAAIERIMDLFAREIDMDPRSCAVAI